MEGVGEARYGDVMTTAATRERIEFADALSEVGPDAPTLCEGWSARDLAAHVVLRERRPDAAGGVLIGALSRYTDRVQRKIAGTPWPELVDTVRSGPSWWSPTRLGAIDRAANTIEFFVHHEDIRRATDPWAPRELDDELIDDLHGALARAVRLLVRRAPVGVVLEPTDGRAPIVAKKGEPAVTVRGPVGELVLFVYGRSAHALVELDGGSADVEKLRGTSFGV